jgi:hypothetical protein
MNILSKTVGSAVSDKRKSVTYVPFINHSPKLASGNASNGFSCMPASRRTSASEHDEELAGDSSSRVSPVPCNPPHSILTKGSGRYGDDEASHFGNTYNAGMMLDEQLDQEMHSMYIWCVMPWFSLGFSRCYEECPHIGRQVPRNTNKV